MLQLNVPAAHSAFEQARRMALHRSVVGRANIFGYKNNDGLQDSTRASSLFVEGRDECEDPRVSSTHAWKGR